MLSVFNHIEFIEQYCKGIKTMNQYKCKPKELLFNENDLKIFNTIYKYFLSSNLNILERSKSGTIKKVRGNHYAWDCRTSSLGGLITIIMSGKMYSIKIGTFKSKDKSIFPNVAFSMFKELCNKNGIDLDKYKIDNGIEVKKTIQKPLILMYYKDQVLYNVHHLDYHSSYATGLCNTHPEFKPIIEILYNGRKEHSEYKDVLNMTIGMMQSIKNGRQAEWAHLSRDAIADNNRRIIELYNKLLLSGRKIVGFNTDGIWYQGELYHDENEGNNIGQWANDHIDCVFRSKSSGAYEFIENGVYYPVIRGSTKLDDIKPRNEWQWGDIYKEGIILYEFDEKEGFIKNEVQTQ